MRLIDRNDIENWAERIDSKANLPILMSKLVRATAPISTFCDFPSGTAAYMGGWDGIIRCQEQRSYVPMGISLWEFGTEANVGKKAESDYDKRTRDSLGYNPIECTFIFITPRMWKNKNKWMTEKLAEKKWKDVKAYDSRDLEQWLDTASAVGRWFSSYVNKYPFDGVQTSEEFWEEWSIGPTCTLMPEVVTAGRTSEKDKLQQFLKSPPGIRGVKASTKNEAIAFIIACAKQFDQN